MRSPPSCARWCPPRSRCSAAVGEIIAAVRAGGDEAVRELHPPFDTAGADPAPLQACRRELDAAAERLEPAVRAGLRHAIENVRRVARRGVATRTEWCRSGGHKVALREAPVEAAAVYVPGGRAPYPSTVVMGVVTAQESRASRRSRCARRPDAAATSTRWCSARADWRARRSSTGWAARRRSRRSRTERVGRRGRCDRRTGEPVRAGGQAPGVRPGRESTGSPARAIWWWSPTATRNPGRWRSICWPRPSTVPARWWSAISSSAELLGQLAGRSNWLPAAGPWRGWCRRETLRQHSRWPRRSRRSTSSWSGAEIEALAPRATRAGCVFVGLASGDRIRRLHRRLQPHPADRRRRAVRLGASSRLTFAAASPRCGFRRRRPPSLARTAAPVARAEGFELHARSMEARIRDNG